jgi:hypothetical protein
MGADLYILKVYDPGTIGWVFDHTLTSVRKGYFRDPYNEGGLFNFLRSNTTHDDLSWWALRAKTEWFNRKRNMTLEGVRDFLDIVCDAKEQIYLKDKLYLDVYDHQDKIKKRELLSFSDGLEYKEWLECLIVFLELAIKKRSTIKWSV